MENLSYQGDNFVLPEKKRRTRKNAEKKSGARNIVGKVSWLDGEIVCWSGEKPEINYAGDCFFRPITVVIADALSGKASGIYTISLDYQRAASIGVSSPPEDVARLVNPVVGPITRVTEPLIAKTARTLEAARRYPKALPPLVGDLFSWIEKKKANLARARSALDALHPPGRNLVRSLALEENCLWIGSDAGRPSSVITTEQISQNLEKGVDISDTGMCAAAILFGQRHAAGGLSGNIGSYAIIGGRLSQWPADVILRVFYGSSGERDRNPFPEHIPPELNSPECAQAALEWVLVNRDRVSIRDLSSMLQLLPAIQLAYNDPERRFGLLLSQLNRAFDDISLLPIYRKGQKTAVTHLPGSGRLTHQLAESISDELNRERKAVGIKPLKDNQPFYYYVEAAVSWFLGYKVNDPLLSNIAKLHCHDPVEYERRLLLLLTPIKKRAGSPGPEYLTGLCCLAGRVAGISGRKAVSAIAVWLNVCRIYCVPGDTNDGALRLALETIEAVSGYSGCRQEKLSRSMNSLARSGGKLIECAGREYEKTISPRSYNRDDISNIFGNLRLIWFLAEVTDDEFESLIEYDLFMPARMIAKYNPDELNAFIRMASRLAEKGSDRFSYNDTIWADLFCCGDRKLVEETLAWIELLGDSYGLTWKKICHLVREIVGFCYPYNEDYGRRFDKDRVLFIRRNFWIIKRITRSVKMVLKMTPEMGFDDWKDPAEHISNRLDAIEIAYQWHRRGYDDIELTVKSLLNYCLRKEKEAIKQAKQNPPQCLWQDTEDCNLSIDVSRGSPRSLVNLIDCLLRGRYDTARLIRGWDFLKSAPAIRIFLSRCSERAEQVRPSLLALQRIAFAIRLQANRELRAGFKEWEKPPAKYSRGHEYSVPAEYYGRLERVIRLRTLTGEEEVLPRTLVKGLERARLLEREYISLKKRKQLDERMRARLQKLKRLLAAPELIEEQRRRDIDKILDKQEVLSGLSALNSIIDRVTRQHREYVFGTSFEADMTPDLENALVIYYNIKKNRRLLRSFLRGVVKGEGIWQHPANLEFAERMRSSGVKIEIWLGPFEREYRLGRRTWRIYRETDPLKILQMGNLFGTCLSADDFNAFATVANALEANKQVIYVEGPRGKIVGRKLIAISGNGALFGFNSYGSKESGDEGGGFPWIKIFLDLFCREYAAACNLRFATFADKQEIYLCRADEGLYYEDDEKAKKSFHLFAHWYFDGAEEFDWWVTGRENSDDYFHVRDCPWNVLTRFIRLQLRMKREATLRWLIRMGDDAREILGYLVENIFLDKQSVKFVEYYTNSEKVKALLCSKIY